MPTYCTVTFLFYQHHSSIKVIACNLYILQTNAIKNEIRYFIASQNIALSTNYTTSRECERMISDELKSKIDTIQKDIKKTEPNAEAHLTRFVPMKKD